MPRYRGRLTTPLDDMRGLVLVLSMVVVDVVGGPCSQMSQAPLRFGLVARCTRSTLTLMASARGLTLARCVLLALKKGALALSHSQTRSLCHLHACPETAPRLATLTPDKDFDYHSLYHKVLPSEAQRCVEGVGVVSFHPRRANHSAALAACLAEGGQLAHVVGETRTKNLAAILPTPETRAFVGLDDVAREGVFVAATGAPLSCYTHRAWAAREPGAAIPDQDCVVLGYERLWGVVRCKHKFAFLCEFRQLLPQQCAMRSQLRFRRECLKWKRRVVTSRKRHMYCSMNATKVD